MKYYSEKTKKFYDTEEAVKAAEKEFDEKELEAVKFKEERAQRAKAVDEAYDAAQKAIANYNKLLNDFIKDYKYYHYSASKAVQTPRNILEAFFSWPF